VLSAQSGSYLSKSEIMRICNVYGKGKGCEQKLGDKENLAAVDVKGNAMEDLEESESDPDDVNMILNLAIATANLPNEDVDWNNIEGLLKAEKQAAIVKNSPETTFIPKYSKKLENRDFFKRLPQKIQGQLQTAAMNCTP
jgi:hypothetical protein